MLRNPSDSSPRWWLDGSEDPDAYTCASSIADPSSLTQPVSLMWRNGRQAMTQGSPAEWAEPGSSPSDAGRAFTLSSGSKSLVLYQPRKSETNCAISWDLVLRFPQCEDIQEIRTGSNPVPSYMEIPQGQPVLVVGSENAWAVRLRATHPDLRGIPLYFDETEDGLFLILHLADFGKERQLKDEDLLRYSALITFEEKLLNNPRALEGFEHDLANQEIWDDLNNPYLRQAGFIGDGFKLTGTLNPLEEEWIDQLVVGS